MRNKKLYQIGLAICTFCLSFFDGVYWSGISIIFFGEPEYPTKE